MSEFKEKAKALREERKVLVSRLKSIRADLKAAREALRAETPPKTGKRRSKLAPRIQAIFGYGAFAVGELISKGVYDQRSSANVAICNAVKNGVLVRVQRGVYKLAGGPTAEAPIAAPAVTPDANDDAPTVADVMAEAAAAA